MSNQTAFTELGYNDDMPSNQYEWGMEPIESSTARNQLTIEECRDGEIIFTKKGFPSHYVVAKNGRTYRIRIDSPVYSDKDSAETARMIGLFIEVKDGVIRFVKNEGEVWKVKYFKES